jgi:hypothetical protein
MFSDVEAVGHVSTFSWVNYGKALETCQLISMDIPSEKPHGLALVTKDKIRRLTTMDPIMPPNTEPKDIMRHHM